MFAEKYKNNQQEITTEITEIIKNIITKNQYNTERKEKEGHDETKSYHRNIHQPKEMPLIIQIMK